MDGCLNSLYEAKFSNLTGHQTDLSALLISLGQTSRLFFVAPQISLGRKPAPSHIVLTYFYISRYQWVPCPLCFAAAPMWTHLQFSTHSPPKVQRESIIHPVRWALGHYALPKIPHKSAPILNQIHKRSMLRDYLGVGSYVETDQLSQPIDLSF